MDDLIDVMQAWTTLIGFLLVPVLLFLIFHVGEIMWQDGKELGSFYLVLACSFGLFWIILFQQKHRIYGALLQHILDRMSNRFRKTTRADRITPLMSEDLPQSSGEASTLFYSLEIKDDVKFKVAWSCCMFIDSMSWYLPFPRITGDGWRNHEEQAQAQDQA